MAVLGRIERRLALAIVMTAVIPLVVAIYFASTLADYYFAQAFRPELGQHLDRALGVYQELVHRIKDDMRHEAEALGAQQKLREAATRGDDAAVTAFLQEALPRYPDLAKIEVLSADGQVRVSHDRGRPIDDASEATLEVRRPLGDGADSPVLLAQFATPRARFEELERTSEFVRDYHQIEGARIKLKRSDVLAFASFLGITIVVAVAIATLLARTVTRRIAALAQATQTVAGGDLGVRVSETGKDELSELSRGFNRMLQEVEASRARIEFLQRMSSWQEMARRLAHEIKNPLTPILLAVEECHRKYAGNDPTYRKLLDTTLEVVEEEVGTLRRLVGEFSSFARLPRAELALHDLGAFLREQEERRVLVDEMAEGGDARRPETDALATAVTTSWKVPKEPMPAYLDPQMLRRVLVNVVRNAAQAIVAEKSAGHVEIKAATVPGGYLLTVDDDGPGVPEDRRPSIFDPYVTTKADGTGLGLAIVKKIVVEHGGTVEVERSHLGGARLQIRIPSASSAAGTAARELEGRSSLSEPPAQSVAGAPRGAER